MKRERSGKILLEEMQTEILARLPVKVLLRFRCVCKLWRSLIDSHNFAKRQLVCYNTIDRLKEAPLVVVEAPETKHVYKEIICSVRNNNNFDIVDRSRFEIGIHRGEFFDVVGHANGVLCFKILMNNVLEKIALSNPYIRTHLDIPLPPVAEKVRVSEKSLTGKSRCYVDLAFGYDLAQQHYKILAMGYPFEEVRTGELEFEKIPNVFEIYAKGEESYSWRSIVGPGIEDSPCAWCWRQTKVFLNGAVHFMGYGKDDDLNYTHFVVFDMCNEKFSYMELPVCEDPYDRVEVRNRLFPVVVSGELLGLVELDRYRTNIWVMKEYGNKETWVCRYGISGSSDIYQGYLYLKRDFDLLYVHPWKGKLMGFHFGEGVHGSIAKRFPMPRYMDAFVESLMLLDGKRPRPKWNFNF